MMLGAHLTSRRMLLLPLDTVFCFFHAPPLLLLFSAVLARVIRWNYRVQTLAELAIV
uniref:Uncharacterized protein n=1 Tax=Arundo donax TaxID=35708 RepID=A0A0A8Z419_ARUDO